MSLFVDGFSSGFFQPNFAGAAIRIDAVWQAAEPPDVGAGVDTIGRSLSPGPLCPSPHTTARNFSQ